MAITHIFKDGTRRESLEGVEVPASIAMRVKEIAIEAEQEEKKD